MKNTLKFKDINEKLNKVKTSLFVTALFKNESFSYYTLL